jgi:hypothetical protein
MKNLEGVLEDKQACFERLLREIEALRIAVRLLAEDSDPSPYTSSAAVESKKTGNVSDTQQPLPTDADLNPLIDLEPLSDEAILDPSQWNSGTYLKT